MDEKPGKKTVLQQLADQALAKQFMEATQRVLKEARSVESPDLSTAKPKNEGPEEAMKAVRVLLEEIVNAGLDLAHAKERDVLSYHKREGFPFALTIPSVSPQVSMHQDTHLMIRTNANITDFNFTLIRILIEDAGIRTTIDAAQGLRAQSKVISHDGGDSGRSYSFLFTQEGWNQLLDYIGEARVTLLGQEHEVADARLQGAIGQWREGRSAQRGQSGGPGADGERSKKFVEGLAQERNPLTSDRGGRIGR